MLDVGNAIAREWIDRLRRDSMTWTLPDDTNASPNWATNTFIISQIGSTTNAGTWVWPTAPTTGSNQGASSWGYSRGFDILGRDLVMTAAAPWPGLVFCTNIRGDWIVQDQSLRAEVRVYWLRQMFAAPSGTFCSGVNENPSATGTGGGTQMYHFIYAATALNRNGAQ
jgi:hypothetical protein